MTGLLNDLLSNLDNSLMERADEADQREEARGSGGSDFRKLPIVAKEQRKYVYIMFLLPFKPEGAAGAQLFWDSYSHYGLPKKDEKDYGMRKCNNYMEQGSCPFCAVIEAELEHRHDKESRKEVYRYQARGYSFMNAIPLFIDGERVAKSEAYPYLPHIVKLPQKHTDTLIQALRSEGALGSGNVADNPFNPMNSMPLNITITRTGSQQMNVEYDVRLGATRKPIAPSEAEAIEIMNECYDLSKIYRGPSEDELKVYREEAVNFAKFLAEQRRGGSKSDVAVNTSSVPAALPKTDPVGSDDLENFLAG